MAVWMWIEMGMWMYQQRVSKTRPPPPAPPKPSSPQQSTISHSQLQATKKNDIPVLPPHPLSQLLSGILLLLMRLGVGVEEEGVREGGREKKVLGEMGGRRWRGGGTWWRIRGRRRMVVWWDDKEDRLRRIGIVFFLA